MLIDVAKVVDAAQHSGRFAPARRGYWLAEVGAGGQRGAKAITDLVMATPADPHTRARWARAGSVAASAQDEQQAAEDALYASLYPTSEQAADDAARRDRETGQTALRFAEYERRFDNKMTAAAPAHHEVIDHSAVTVPEHEHHHSDHAGGYHTHTHGHAADASHLPRADLHIHQASAAADPIAAALNLRARTAGQQISTEEETYGRMRFGRN